MEGTRLSAPNRTVAREFAREINRWYRVCIETAHTFYELASEREHWIMSIEPKIPALLAGDGETQRVLRQQWGVIWEILLPDAKAQRERMYALEQEADIFAREIARASDRLDAIKEKHRLSQKTKTSHL